MKNPSPIRKRIELLLKATFVMGLLYFLAKKGLLSMNQTRRAFSHWEQTGPAVFMLGICMLLGVLRWQLLLRAQGIQLRLARTFQLTLIGNFFNIALPGAVSGDFVKAYYIGREAHGKRARAFGSILFDRVAGLSALVVVSSGALLLKLRSFEGTSMFRETWFLILTGAIAVLAGYLYLFLVREHHDPLLIFFRKLEKRFEKAGSITRIYEGLRHYHHHRWTVIQVLMISILIHSIIGWSLLNFGFAMGESHLDPLAVFVVFPLGLLVTAIPIMPAGIGTGHVAMGYLFQLLGSQRGADIFTLYAVSNIFYSALGGIAYLRFKADNPEVELGKLSSGTFPAA